MVPLWPTMYTAGSLARTAALTGWSIFAICVAVAVTRSSRGDSNWGTSTPGDAVGSLVPGSGAVFLVLVFVVVSPVASCGGDPVVSLPQAVAIISDTAAMIDRPLSRRISAGRP